MKVGVRKPSVGKRVKARTTGRVKRSVKKAVIPYYGVKGTGIIKNPKKAVYNKVYKNITIGVDDLIAVGMTASGNERKKQNKAATSQVTDDSRFKDAKTPKGKLRGVGWLLRILGILFFFLAVIGLLAESNALMLIGVGGGVIAWCYGGNFREVTITEIVSEEDDEEQSEINIEVDTIAEKAE